MVQYCNALAQDMKFSDILGAIIVSLSTNTPFEKLVNPVNLQVSYRNSKYLDTEKEAYYSLLLQYHLNQDGLDELLSQTGLSPTQVLTAASDFQAKYNLYVVDSKVTAYEDSQPVDSVYNKYQMPGASDSINNLSIDRMYGMVTYTKQLMALKGKNGLDLNLGLRYDQDDILTNGNLKDIEQIPKAYQARYTVDIYYVSNGQSELKFTGYHHYSEIYRDPSRHNEMLAKTSFVTDYDSFLQVKVVTDVELTTKDAGTLESANAKPWSYNNSRYNLGHGWAFNLPSIEINSSSPSDGKHNILHFPDGQKYSISYDGSNYKLLGYNFKDFELLNAQPNEFSSGGRSAQWVLVNKIGKSDYFGSAGEYLGSSDYRGTEATASIHVSYGSDNQISEIIDSVGRRLTVSSTFVDTEYEGSDYYRQDYRLYDVGDTTGELLFKIHKVYDQTTQAWEIERVVFCDKGAAVKAEVYAYSLIQANILFNGSGGFLYDDKNNVVPYPYKKYEQKNRILRMIDQYNCYVSDDGLEHLNEGGPQEQISISYEVANRMISDATWRNYGRVCAIQRSGYEPENPDVDQRYPVRDRKEYKYWAIDKETGSKEPLWLNGSYASFDECLFPKNYKNEYELQINEVMTEANTPMKTTRYHYDAQKINKETNVYKVENGSEILYSRTNTEFDARHQTPKKEVIRRVGNGTELCVINTTEYDDYGNQIRNKVETGYSHNFGTPVITNCSEDVTRTYFPDNKIIPRIEYSTIFNPNSNEKYLYYVENEFSNSSKENITSVRTYIDNPVSGQPDLNLNMIVYSYDDQKRLTGQSVYSKYNDDFDSSSISYAYDDKYGIYPAVVTKSGTVKSSDGRATDSKLYYTYDKFGRVIEYKDNDQAHVTRMTYDNMGTQTSITYPDNTTETVDVYLLQNATVQTLKDGTRLRYIYNRFGQLICEQKYNTDTNQFFDLKRYEYNANNQIDKSYEYSNPEATEYNQIEYQYDFLGRTTSIKVSDQTGTVLSHETICYEITTFEGTPCEKTTITTYKGENEYSHKIEYEDAAGNLIAVETEYEPGKYYSDRYYYYSFGKLNYCQGDTIAKQTYQYDMAGRVIGITDANNQTVKMKYDTLDQLRQQQDAQGNITDYEYTRSGQIHRIQKQFITNGTTTYSTEQKNYFDAFGNVIQTKLANNKPGDPVSYKDTTYKYDVNGNVIQVAEKLSATESIYTQYCYNINGDIEKVFTGLKSPLTIVDKDNYTPSTDSDFSITEYSYDKNGNMVRYTDPLGKSEEYQYNFSNLMTGKTLRNGKSYSYTYDQLGRNLTATIHDQSVQTAYDQLGRVTSKSNQNGTTTYSYDLLGRVLTEIRDDQDDSRDYKIEYTYSPQGIKSKKLSVFNTDSNTFEEKNYESFTYDNLFRLSELTQKNTQAGNVNVNATYAYDSLNQLTEKIVKLGANTVKQNYSYNKAGLTTQIEQYQKNASGSYELGWSENYTYKLDGNLTQKQDSLGNVTTYQYDALGRLLEEQLVANNINRWKDSYSFDDYSNQARKVHTDYTNNTTTSTAYTYDKANRLQTEQSVQGVSTTNYNYKYDASGNLIAKNQVQNGVETELLSYQYDDFNRLSKVVTADKTSEYKYDANDQRISKQVGNQKTNHIWSGSNIVFDKITYTEQPVAPDKTQLQQKITEALAIDLEQYQESGKADFQSALAQAQSVYESPTSTQDEVSAALEALITAIGNLQEIVSNANKDALRSMILSAAGLDMDKYQETGKAEFLAALAEAQRIEKQASATQEQVDAATNTLLFAMMDLRLKPSKSSRDAFQLTRPEQMTTIDMERYQREHVIDFTLYTAQSLKTAILSSTYFVYQDNTEEETNQQEIAAAFSALLTSNPEPFEQSYTYGVNGLESMTNNKTPYSYMTNLRGDVVGLNSGTQATNQYQYSAYGNSTSKTETIANPFQYAGQYVDSETGNYYLRARYYDPSIGRFTQEDTYHGTAASPQTLNLYNYCASNPVQNADPSGHFLDTLLDIASVAWSAYDFIKNPSWGNAAMLAWDVGAALLPFVPGSYVGKGVKALSKADDLYDAYRMYKGARVVYKAVTTAVKIVDKVVDTAKAVKKTVTATKAFKTANKVVDKVKTVTKSAQEIMADITRKIEQQKKITRAKNLDITENLVKQAESTAAAKGKLTFSSSNNTAYRALNQKDYDRYTNGLGLEAKNTNGSWSLKEHLVNGSGKQSWANDPFLSTTTDLNVAKGFNKAGSNLGVVAIDLDKLTSKTYKGYEIYPRVNGVDGLPYHYSIWQQEVSVQGSIPRDAIIGIVE